MERLAKALGIENISSSQVSEINKGLEEQVDAFRSRPLEKVRVEDQVVTLALMIAHGVNSAGNREILAAEPMFDESEESWREFFRKLKKRGSKRVCAGIQAAVKKSLWERAGSAAKFT